MKRVQDNTRLDWIDQLKGITMIFIVLGHMTVYKGAPHVVFCYSFHIPLFFMISGMTARLSRDRHPIMTEKFSAFLLKKFKQLVIPYFLLNLVCIPLYYLNYSVLMDGAAPLPELIGGMFYSNQDFIEAPSNATWFLLTLFLAELVFEMLERILWCNPVKLLIFGLAGFLLSFADSLYSTGVCYVWHLQVVPGAIFFMALGYYFFDNKEQIIGFIDRLRPIVLRIFVLVLIFAAGVYFGQVNGKVSMPGSHYNSPVLFLLAAGCVSWVIIYVSIKMPALWFFRFIGKNTLTYMAFQAVLIASFRGIFEWGNELIYKNPYLVTAIIILVLIPISMFINKCLPFLVGKKYKKSNAKI